MSIIRAKAEQGYREIVGTDNGELKLLTFGVLTLEAGEHYVGSTGDQEKVLILLQGQIQVETEGKVFTGVRKSVFAERATAFYLPAQSSFEVSNIGADRLQAGLCGTPSDEKHEPFQVLPDELWVRTVGKDNWQREVHDIVVKNAEGRVHHIIVGETFNQAGMWSSFPPHKHDDYQLGVEANMEEVYYYQLNPSQGFGVQANYTLDGSVDEAFRVQHGDTFLISKGYHPVCAAGGYQLYYLWIMAGPLDRVMIPNDDPAHAWVKE